MKANKFKFKININEIKQENKNKEHDFEKQIQVLKEEKTTEKYIIKENNLDSINKDKVRKNKSPLPNLDPHKIREEYEKKIQEKMKEIKGNYTESEKRDMVLMELKTTTNYLDEKQKIKEKINIEKIKEKEDMEVNKKIDEINTNESYFDKKLLVLNEMSTKKNYINQEEVKKFIENMPKSKLEILNEKSEILDGPSCTNITADSTFQDSKEGKDQFGKTSTENEKFLLSFSGEEFINEELNLKQFNEARTQVYLKNKLFDYLLIKRYPTKILPEKYKIDDIHYVFAYQNNLQTYPVTQNEVLKHTKEVIKTNNLDEPFGLHFCGKKIKLEGETKIMECSPNNFICKECMENNKKRYKLPENYLININGRISKKMKGYYHCLGTFKEGNIFNCCNKEFTCKACKILNLYKNYYIE